MATQAQRRETARARILQAARQLAAAGGFSGSSVEQIGIASGMSRGAVGFHFGSKAGLLEELVEATIAGWRRQAASADLGDGSPRAVLDGHCTWWTADAANGRLALMFVYEAVGPAPDTATVLRRERAVLANEIERQLTEFRDSGAIASTVDTAVASELLIGALLGVAGEVALDSGVEAASAYRAATELLLGAWQARNP